MSQYQSNTAKSKSKLKSQSRGRRPRSRHSHTLHTRPNSEDDSDTGSVSSQPKQRKQHAALHRLLRPLTCAPASAVIASHLPPSLSDSPDSDPESDSSASNSDLDSARPNMLTTHARLPPTSAPPPGAPSVAAGPPVLLPTPPVGLDGPSRAQALRRSTLSLLRPTPATSPGIPRPPRPARPTAVPTSTIVSPLSQSPIHAFHAMLETQDQRVRDQWAQQYLNNGLAGPAPKGWRMASITKSPLYNLKDTRGTVPSLKLFALAAYLRRVQVALHHVPAAAAGSAWDTRWLTRLVPAHVLPLDLRQLILYHLPFYVTPTDATMPLWLAADSASAALEYVNLSNGRFSAHLLAQVLDPAISRSSSSSNTHSPGSRCDSGMLNDPVPDRWDTLSDDPDNVPMPLSAWLPTAPPPLISLDLSFCTLPQSDLVRILTSSSRAASLLHLNLSGVHFTLSDAGWSLSTLSHHLLHLVGLEVNYAPWVSKDVLASVDWACRWRNMRVLAMHKSVVQGVHDVGAIVAWMATVRPDVRVLVDAP